MSKEALPQIRMLLEGRNHKPDTSNSLVFFNHNGKKVLAYWVAVPIEDELIEGSCFFPLDPTNKIENPVCIDILTGEVWERESNAEAYPLKEYPMILCEKDAYEFE